MDYHKILRVIQDNNKSMSLYEIANKLEVEPNTLIKDCEFLLNEKYTKSVLALGMPPEKTAFDSEQKFMITPKGKHFLNRDDIALDLWILNTLYQNTYDLESLKEQTLKRVAKTTEERFEDSLNRLKVCDMINFDECTLSENGHQYFKDHLIGEFRLLRSYVDQIADKGNCRPKLFFEKIIDSENIEQSLIRFIDESVVSFIDILFELEQETDANYGIGRIFRP